MPKQRYQQDLLTKDFHHDEAQAAVVEHLERLANELTLHTNKPARKNWLTTIFKNKRAVTTSPQGLYIWGTVGRGKTYLMDIFYDCVQTKQKQRMHFHRFMLEVHKQLRATSNSENPLHRVAEQLSNNTRVICLDEFYVSDIGDAMILAGLLDALFARGITMVTTSNCAPDLLYPNGLQRQRFLPAIELIKKYMLSVELGGNTDHRLRYLQSADIYYCPLNSDTESNMHNAFTHVSPDSGTSNEVLIINDRKITSKRCADGVVWFDFVELCDGPRSAADYIEIARFYNTILLSNVPILTNKDDTARRFITAIDEFYDRNVNMIISAEAHAHELYKGKRLAFEFQRTVSRLIEMQSHDYLAKPHQSL
jgi:cell division protein ZapE